MCLATVIRFIHNVDETLTALWVVFDGTAADADPILTGIVNDPIIIFSKSPTFIGPLRMLRLTDGESLEFVEFADGGGR